MDFEHLPYRTVSDDKTPITTLYSDTVYQDVISVDFTPSNELNTDGTPFEENKARYADEETVFFRYETPYDISEFTVPKEAIIPKNGTVNQYLSDTNSSGTSNDIIIYPNQSLGVINRNHSSVEIGYPEGSAVYLEVNENFIYTGIDPKVTVKYDSTGKQWLVYDISGVDTSPSNSNNNRVPLVQLNAEDFFVDGVSGNKNLFDNTYIDYGPLLGISPDESPYVSVVEVEANLTLFEEAPAEIVNANSKLYKMAESTQYLAENHFVNISSAAMNSLSVTPRMLNDDDEYIIGFMQSNGISNINYEGNNSDNLIANIHLSREEAYTNYNLTINLPETSDTSLKLLPRDEANFMNSIHLPDHWGNPTAQSYDSETGVIELVFADGLPFESTKSDRVTIDLKALAEDVYTKDDDTQSLITVSHKYTIGTAAEVTPVSPADIGFTLKWYEVSGLGFIDKSDPLRIPAAYIGNGQYDDDEEFIVNNADLNSIELINNNQSTTDIAEGKSRVADFTWVKENGEYTGKYTIKLQPSASMIDLLFSIPTELQDIYSITKYPIAGTSGVDVLRTNNHPSNGIDGIHIEATIENGLRSIGDTGQNLRQDDIELDAVDIGVYAEPVTVEFRDLDSDKNIDTKKVDRGDPVEKTTNTLTNPEANSNLEGWFEDSNGNGKLDTNEELWLFKGETNAPVIYENKVLTPYVKWPVVFEDPSDLTKDLKTEDVEHKTNATQPTDTELDGKLEANEKILGWFEDEDGDGVKDPGEEYWDFETDIVDRPITLTPDIGIKHTVTFEDEDAETVYEQKDADDGTTITPPTTPPTDLDGNDPTGWFEDLDNDGVKDPDEDFWDFDKDIVEENITLTPYYTHTVTFDDEIYGTTGVGDEIYHIEENVPHNTTVDEPTVDLPTKGGKNPELWFEDLNGNGKYDDGEEWEFTTPIIRDVTLHPYYEFTVTFEDNDENIHEETTVPDGSTIDPPTTPPKDDNGEDPSGWFEDLDGDGEKDPGEDWDFDDDTVDKDVVLKPYYTHTVTFEKSPNGDPESNLDNHATQEVDKNDFVKEETAPTDPNGGTFVEWQIKDETTGEKSKYDFTTPVDKDITLYPYFIYDVTVENTYNVADNGTGTYGPNEKVEVNAGTRDGFTFIGWTVTTGNENTTITLSSEITNIADFIMPGDNVTLIANWEENVEPTPTVAPTATPAPQEPVPNPTVAPTVRPVPTLPVITDGEATPEPEQTPEPTEEPTAEPTLAPTPAPTPDTGAKLPETDGTDEEPKAPAKVEVNGNELDEDDYYVDEGGNLVLQPEFLETLPDGEHVITIVTPDNEEYEAVVIMENGVPLAYSTFTVSNGNAWSLFDLVMTITSSLLVLAFIVSKAKKDKEDEEKQNAENEETPKQRRRKLTTFVLFILAIFSIILLFITQDFTQPMTIFDRWSIIFAVVGIVQVLMMIIFKKKYQDEDEQKSYQ